MFLGRRGRLGLLLGLCAGGCECDERLALLAGSLEIEPATVDFGSVPVGVFSREPVVLRNGGSFRLEVSSVGARPPFSIDLDTGLLLFPGSSTVAVVGFRPDRVGPFEAAVTIETDEAGVAPAELTCLGEGIEASVLVEPAVLDFGDVPRETGAAPATGTVTVTNQGSDAFDLTSVGVEMGSGGRFEVAPEATLGRFAPGEQRVIEVGFAPEARGPHRGRLVLRTTAPDGAEVEVELLGQGVGPRFELCTESHDGAEACTERGEAPRLVLGGIDVGERGAGRIRVHNRGERELAIDLAALGGGSPEFGFSPEPVATPNFRVGPGGTWTMEASYVPVDYVFDAINLVFESNDPERPSQTVLVEGRVPRPVANAIPRSLSFRLTGGSANEARAPVLLVNCGERPLRLLDARGTGEGFRFEGLPAPGSEVSPGDCTADAPGLEIEVVFSPPRSGSFSGELELRTSDPADPVLTVQVVGARS